MWAWSVALAAIIMAEAGPPQAISPVPTAEGTAAAVAWIKADAHILSGADASSDELKPISRRVAGARVIGLGEATHGDHEDQQFKANLIKQLVRDKVINAVVLEANRDVARGFDAYIRQGEGEPIALMRSTSFFRISRDEEFASLLTWLRAWNQTADQPVRIFGIDDQDAGRDAAFALAFIGRHDKALAARLGVPFAGLIPDDGKTFPKAAFWIMGHTTADIQTIEMAARKLADTLEAHGSKWSSEPDYEEAVYAAEVSWQCFNIFEREGKDAKPVTATADTYYARRDVFMAKNLLRRLQKDDHAAIWAHDEHVVDTIPVSYANAGYSTLGRELRANLGSDYLALGTTWSKGHISAVVGPYEKIRADMPETVVAVSNDSPRGIGSIFDPLPAEAAWIDLKARPRTLLLDEWVKSDYFLGQSGWGIEPEKFQTEPRGTLDEVLPVDKGFDLLVWFRTITPTRRLP